MTGIDVILDRNRTNDTVATVSHDSHRLDVCLSTT